MSRISDFSAIVGVLVGAGVGEVGAGVGDAIVGVFVGAAVGDGVGYKHIFHPADCVQPSVAQVTTSPAETATSSGPDNPLYSIDLIFSLSKEVSVEKVAALILPPRFTVMLQLTEFGEVRG
jgi:hypothetical protein